MGCKEEPQKKKRAARPLPVVEIAQAEVQLLNHQIIVTGTLKANRTIHFYNQAQGLLKSLPFHEGDRVESGQLLAQLDDTIIRAEYDKTTATLKQTKIDYQRLKKLAPLNLTSKELLTRAKTRVALDQSEYNLQKKRLTYTQIKAPWSGIISERLVEPGDVLPLYTHFMSLIDTSSLNVKIPLSELSLNKIKAGDEISFVIDALGNKTWLGNILRIHPNVDSITRKGIIEVKINPVPPGARPGQLARIKLSTAKHQVLVIPLSAIRYNQHGAYVFTLDSENTINLTAITTGQKYPRYMEILEGLKTGDRVIKKGLFGLSSGNKVKIIEYSD
ncbi:MAG: efflux RND transporter periplasmic adaptor subunit [gamma proteobacterium symbiont of Taylorina sp.]|nr:efflux RND transporter periplasmic adaptor subunit [gamma proteobacterium symbiont of Taylorina sp.]